MKQNEKRDKIVTLSTKNKEFNRLCESRGGEETREKRQINLKKKDQATIRMLMNEHLYQKTGQNLTKLSGKDLWTLKGILEDLMDQNEDRVEELKSKCIRIPNLAQFSPKNTFF